MDSYNPPQIAEINKKDNKNNRKKVIWLIASILIVIIGSILVIFSQMGNNDKEDIITPPTQTPIVETSPSPTETPTPTVEPIIKDFDISVDGVSYTTKEELSSAVKSSNWIPVKYACVGVTLNEALEDYYTAEDKIDIKYTNGSMDTEYSKPCIEYITDPKIIRNDLSNTGASYRQHYETMYSFDEDIYMKTKARDIEAADWLYFQAMRDYNSFFFMISDIGIEQIRDNPCYTIDTAVDYRKSKESQYVFPGGCIASLSYEPNSWEIINTPEKEAAYRDGYLYAEKITS